jgi:membrane protease YdiL (CAAX protease family)
MHRHLCRFQQQPAVSGRRFANFRKLRSVLFAVLAVLCGFAACHAQASDDSTRQIESTALDASDENSLDAAREAAKLAVPALEAKDWRACYPALQAHEALTLSKLEEDLELAGQVTALMPPAILKGLAEFPAEESERESLLAVTNWLAHLLLDNPTPENQRIVAQLLKSWKQAAPEDHQVGLAQLSLLVSQGAQEDLIKLAEAITRDETQDRYWRTWAAGQAFHHLLDESSKPADIERGQAILEIWRTLDPEDVTLRINQIWFDWMHGDQRSLFERCGELLEEDDISDEDRATLLAIRFDKALTDGRLNDLSEAEWRQAVSDVFGEGIAHVDPAVLLWTGVIAILAYLGLVVAMTRLWRSKPPGFWLMSLWLSLTLLLPLVIFAPPLISIGFALIGGAAMLWGITGPRAPLHYLKAPVHREGIRFGGPWGWIALCLVCWGFTLGIEFGYQEAFKRVMRRAPEQHVLLGMLIADSPLRFVALLLTAGIFIPLLEEIVFRGVMQDYIGKRVPAIRILLIVSLIFGLLHGLDAALTTGLFGFICSLLRLRYQSLWPAIFLHAFNNSMIVVILYFFPDWV